MEMEGQEERERAPYHLCQWKLISTAVNIKEETTTMSVVVVVEPKRHVIKRSRTFYRHLILSNRSKNK